LAAANNANYWKSHNVQPTEQAARSLILALYCLPFGGAHGLLWVFSQAVPGHRRQIGAKINLAHRPIFNGHGGS
jgi:hypothetical protein